MHLLGSDSNVISTIKAFLTFGLEINCGTSLVVQWVRLHASNEGGAGLIPGWGTKIPHTAQYGQKEKNKMDVIKDQAVSLPTWWGNGDKKVWVVKLYSQAGDRQGNHSIISVNFITAVHWPSGTPLRVTLPNAVSFWIWGSFPVCLKLGPPRCSECLPSFMARGPIQERGPSWSKARSGTQKTLLNTLEWSTWEKNFLKSGHMYI